MPSRPSRETVRRAETGRLPVLHPGRRNRRQTKVHSGALPTAASQPTRNRQDTKPLSRAHESSPRANGKAFSGTKARCAAPTLKSPRAGNPPPVRRSATPVAIRIRMIPPRIPGTSAAKTQFSGPITDPSHPPGRITPEAILFENRVRAVAPSEPMVPSIPRHSAIPFDGEMR